MLVLLKLELALAPCFLLDIFSSFQLGLVLAFTSSSCLALIQLFYWCLLLLGFLVFLVLEWMDVLWCGESADAMPPLRLCCFYPFPVPLIAQSCLVTNLCDAA